MLKILIWKQFYQTFRSYFVDSKTGKAKSKPKIIGMFALFGFVMLGLFSMFYMMATSLLVLLDTNVPWLYYAFFGLLTLGLGIISSLFNTSNTIYNAKDNDLLLSMPIKPQYVLISRIVSIMSLCFIYSSTSWIAICFAGFVYRGFNLVNCIFEIILLFSIVLLSCSISCVGGYVVAFVQNKTKNKSIVTVIISLLFLGVYYYACLRFSDFINSMVANANSIASTVTKWGNLIYQLAIAANGDVKGFVIFVGICSALAIICYLGLKKNFTSIITKSNNVSVASSKVVYKSSNKISSVLLRKEFKRFASSPVYMLNCGLGSAFVLIVAIIFVYKRNDILPLIELFKEEMPVIINFIPLIVIGIVCSIMSINAPVVPSISLEGKNLWILKSLPVNTIDILFAKKKMQLLLNGIPSVISSIIMCYAFRFDFNICVYVVTLVIIFIFVQSSIGSILSLVNPNFTWSSETQPIKQNIFMIVEMLVCWILILGLVAGYYFVKDKMMVDEYMQYVIILFTVIEILLRRSIRSWGVYKFDSL